MFAGKSSKLLEEANRLSTLQGDAVLYLKNIKDKRYSETHIATHTGIQMPCFAVSHLMRDVLPDAQDGGREREADRAKPSAISQRYASSRIVAIDEAQFFGEDLVEFCRRAADEDAKTVVVAGLDGDFMRGKFGHVLDLVPLSDSVVKLRARCAVCGGRAVFSRKIDGDLARQEEIGSSDKYVAVCRLHFENHKR
jgi:thymidine kinase